MGMVDPLNLAFKSPKIVKFLNMRGTMTACRSETHLSLDKALDDQAAKLEKNFKLRVDVFSAEHPVDISAAMEAIQHDGEVERLSKAFEAIVGKVTKLEKSRLARKA